MKQLRWLIFLLFLFLLLLFLLHSCFSKKDKRQAELELGPVGYSVWPDGSLAVAIPVLNEGDGTADAVTVAKVTLNSSTLLAPVALPADLGQIAKGRRGVLQTRFGAGTSGPKTLTVSGTYIASGSSRTFSGTAVLNVAGTIGEAIGTSNTTVPKKSAPNVPLPPLPIRLPSGDTENDGLGAPVPIGPEQHPHVIAPNVTGPQPAPPVGTPGTMGVTIIQDSPSAQPTGVPPDPSTAVASAAGVVIDTNNTYVLFSVDNGKTFAQIDPTTVLPTADGGLCCDQVVIYDPNTDLFFWILQYWASSSGNNRERIAYAHPAALITSFNSWSYFDLTNGTFNSKGSLDYPDIAVTNQYLYMDTDGTDKNGKNGGRIVARMPLSDITGSGGSVGVGYLSPNETTDQTRAFASRLTQQSSDGMYWGGHVDTSHLEVFHWPDSSSQVTTHNTGINKYCNSTFTTLAPDGIQWLDNTRSAGTGGIIAATRKAGTDGGHGQVWLGWEGGKDDASCSEGRSQPYIDIAQIDDTTLDSVGEYDIWNTLYAFGYASLDSSPSGEIGVSVSFGGPSNFAASTVGYLGDYVVYYTDEGDVTEGSSAGTRYGDMFAVRQSGARGVDFSNEAYVYEYVNPTKKSCTTSPGCMYKTHYIQFGRSAPPP
jgi:hypothetical protein